MRKNVFLKFLRRRFKAGFCCIDRLKVKYYRIHFLLFPRAGAADALGFEGLRDLASFNGRLVCLLSFAHGDRKISFLVFVVVNQIS
jgi:hypothetical protein